MSNDRSDDEFFELGLQVRKEVLGADYVDSALRESNDLDRDFQYWIKYRNHNGKCHKFNCQTFEKKFTN